MRCRKSGVEACNTWVRLFMRRQPPYDCLDRPWPSWWRGSKFSMFCPTSPPILENENIFYFDLLVFLSLPQRCTLSDYTAYSLNGILRFMNFCLSMMRLSVQTHSDHYECLPQGCSEGMSYEVIISTQGSTLKIITLSHEREIFLVR